MKLQVESSENEFISLMNKKKAEESEIIARVEQEAFDKMMRFRRWYVIVEFILTITGYAILIYQFNWWVGIGLFLAQWGNNLSQQREVYKDNGNIWKQIWKL